MQDPNRELGRPEAVNIEPTASPTGTEQRPATEVPQVETTPSLEQLLRQAELAAQEHHDAWLRAKAETENVRKRAQAEVASAHKYAIDRFAGALLPVKDSLEAALGTETATAESFKTGVDLTLRQLSAVFSQFNIAEVHPLGEKFDPHKHQAMSAMESDQAPNTVIAVMQKGYLLGDRVIRPALVSVSKAKDS